MVLEGFCNIILIYEPFPHYWNQKIYPFDLHSVIECFFMIIFCIPFHSVETCGRTNILAKNATDIVLKIKLQQLVFILTSIWLLCTSEIVGLEKFLEFVK